MEKRRRPCEDAYAWSHRRGILAECGLKKKTLGSLVVVVFAFSGADQTKDTAKTRAAQDFNVAHTHTHTHTSTIPVGVLVLIAPPFLVLVLLQGLFLATGSLQASTPYLGGVLLAVITTWLFAADSLSKKVE